MKSLQRLREAGRGRDMQAVVDEIPYARFLGVQVDIKGNELTTILPFRETLIGNTTLPALHGGALGAFLEMTSAIQLLYNTNCEALPKTMPPALNRIEVRRVLGEVVNQGATCSPQRYCFQDRYRSCLLLSSVTGSVLAVRSNL